MSRAGSVLFLLLGLAAPAAAQVPSTVAWDLAVGDYTIFGHTVVDSVRAVTRPRGTFAAGLSAWPESSYCSGPATAAMQQLDPRVVLGRIQRAAECGVRLVIVPPRRLISASGAPGGAFAADSARRLTDRYAAVLPADTLRKYRETILGMNLTDDYACLACWGGKGVTQAEIASWAAYTRTRLPGLPLGVRVTPDWVAAHPPLAPLLDYTWAQYHTRKGEAQVYYDTAAELAGRLGLRVVMGVNVEDCYGVGSGPCTAVDLARFGALAVTHPASCAFISWRYREDTWKRSDIRSVWDRLLAEAGKRDARDCRRSGTT